MRPWDASPEGTAESIPQLTQALHPISHPFGTYAIAHPIPALKRRASFIDPSGIMFGASLQKRLDTMATVRCNAGCPFVVSMSTTLRANRGAHVI